MGAVRGSVKNYWQSRELLFGLLVGCPFREVDADCPLLSVRSDNIQTMKRLAFEDIDDVGVDSILSHHRICCYQRDGVVCLH